MVRGLLAIIVLGWLTFPVAAAPRIDAAAINNAEYHAKPTSKDKIDPAIAKAEILLDRARFSPGEVDGKLGENAQKALRAFAEQNGVASDKTIGPELWDKLNAAS